MLLNIERKHENLMLMINITRKIEGQKQQIEKHARAQKI